ncbi:receptor-like protein 12 [Phtheirospermum japonicum]|uniref:Receptor-like protein 12 n=1 Tax=Phtheirospermum japonicum TaxID=374723 RepID=A0A830BLH6_9LAMI|nr:receptor-like protein 12 [Phtheirospermum japonicum]
MQWLSRLSSLEHLDLTGANLSETSNWLQVLNNLPSLVDLRLSRCGLRLFDSIEVVNFTSLRVLDLSANNFDTLVVPHWIGSLEKLVHLDLSDCGLYKHLPIGLRNVTGLRYLNLSSNNFNFTFPSWFNVFVHLKVLDIADNLIHGEVLSTIGNLTSLVRLDLSRNKLEGTLTKSLCNFYRLDELYLSGNMFSGDIQNFLRCISKKLRFLYLGSNKLSGRLPSNLGQLARLREIDLVDNKLTGPLPISLGELRELEYLVISLNSLEGVVSEAHFRNMSRLKIFRANGNELTFRPSESWIPPFQVIGLSLRMWQLGPKFPRWIKHMTSLSYLSLAKTGIVDSIPDWFWDKTISQLGHLNLSGNLIHGQIPSLLNFRSDINVAVDLKCNLIDGPLPPISLSISILDLSHNRISGPMHRFLCNDTEGKNRLEILNVGGNYLSGQIPECWIKWPMLRVLRLEDNNLTGKIPSSIGFLTRLQSLHLRRNNLSGEMPLSLQKCNELMVLDIGRNFLTGRLPIWISRLSKLIVLNLRLNEFWGEIPFELCRLNSLQTLDLAGNNFSGNIPTCFGNFSVMAGKQRLSDHIYYSAVDTFGGVPDSQFLVLKGRFLEYINNLQFVMALDLSDNEFYGSIPVEITRLVRVQALNLSRNSLSGTIPESIADMEFLESLDVSRNKLSGEIPTSISGLTFLSHLNLSYNNLMGRIPTGTQIQGFDRSGFIGNRLCGPPLSGNCDEHNETFETEDEDESDGSLLGGDRFGFFLSAVLGFVFGFWVVLGPLFMNMSWRMTYFRFVTKIGNYVYYVCVKLFVRG